MITLSIIKSYVETSASIDNIGLKKRTRHYSDSRFVYFAMAKKYTKFPLQTIGKYVNRDHTTVLHGIRQISNIIQQDESLRKIYEEVDNRLSLLAVKGEEFNVMTCTNVDLLNQYYRIKHIEHTNKYHSVINNLQAKNKNLEDKLKIIDENMYKEISELNHQDFIQLQNTMKLFLKVKSKLNVKQPLVYSNNKIKQH